MSEIKIIFESTDELLKILSKLNSIVASGKELPDVISNDDLDIIHFVNLLNRGETLCGEILADGIRAVNINKPEKVNCSQCKYVLEKSLSRAERINKKKIE